MTCALQPVLLFDRTGIGQDRIGCATALRTGIGNSGGNSKTKWFSPPRVARGWRGEKKKIDKTGERGFRRALTGLIAKALCLLCLGTDDALIALFRILHLTCTYIIHGRHGGRPAFPIHLRMPPPYAVPCHVISCPCRAEGWPRRRSMRMTGRRRRRATTEHSFLGSGGGRGDSRPSVSCA